MTTADPRVTARFLGAFFDELCRWGVRDVVVSPGSRSTPLAMVAYELSKRFPEKLRLIVDVDERGAAFVALGMAKASGCPSAVICTSGSAVANYYPAVVEAESSRVPLIVLTGDRPPQLQGLGAPQTCDQLHAFGSHVRSFRAMPLPAGDSGSLAFARQAAREAYIDAVGECVVKDCAAPYTVADVEANTASSADSSKASDNKNLDPADSFRISGACFGGPVHLNFPFDEPLKPDTTLPSLFEGGLPEDRGVVGGIVDDAIGGIVGNAVDSIASVLGVSAGNSADEKAADTASDVASNAKSVGVVQIRTTLASDAAKQLSEALLKNRSLLLAGEGSCAEAAEAHAVLNFARAFGMPVLADPLSGLRCFADDLVVANYDSVIKAGGEIPDEALNPQVIVRFGRYPISKRATQWAYGLAASGVQQIVVDPIETRDTNAATTAFVRSRPADFACALAPLGSNADMSFAQAWAKENKEAGKRIAGVGVTSDTSESLFEGLFVRRVLELAPEKSCLFAANSMSVRAVDTFMDASARQLAVLANRGLNGIDGTVSTAIGAAFQYGRTTLVTGDLTMLHDLNSLAMQREFKVQGNAAGLTIVLLNNNGGAIFDMLPQSSDDDYFERLFLTPQDVNFESAAAAFGVSYVRTEDLPSFEQAYNNTLGQPGISLIEVPVPLRGVRKRYGQCW